LKLSEMRRLATLLPKEHLALGIRHASHKCTDAKNGSGVI
jgi:hypothetical protein